MTTDDKRERDGFSRQLLDHQRTALIVLDNILAIRYLNPAAEVLLFNSRQRLQLLPFALCFADSKTVTGNLSECLATGHQFTCREVELRDGTGRVQLVDYSVSRLPQQDGGFRLLVEVQQVDQLQRIAREESWQQAQAAMRQLVRGVAHELKNPLGGIRGAAQLLAGALPDHSLQEYLDVIIDESDRLTELADRMLGIKEAPAMQPVNIHECLERVRQLVQAEWPAIPVTCDYDPSLPELQGDRNQLVQVLLNLLRNAVQALVENHVHQARICLRTRAARWVTLNGVLHRLVLRVEVEDNGPGIPESLREAMFFPLVTGRAKGTGLGLAIAQDIVNRHGGTVECSSRPGRTCFSLLLPVQDTRDNGHV